MNDLLMLAQTAGNTTGPGPAGSAAGAAVLLIVVLGALAISLGIGILVCFLVYKPLSTVPPEHRLVEPGLAFLLLIPLFNLIWNFLFHPKVCDSFRNAFAARGRTDVGDCGRQIAMWYSICSVCALVPCLNYLAGPAALVLLIIYLIKIWDLKAKLEQTSDHGGMPPVPGSAPPTST